MHVGGGAMQKESSMQGTGGVQSQLRATRCNAQGVCEGTWE